MAVDEHEKVWKCSEFRIVHQFVSSVKVTQHHVTCTWSPQWSWNEIFLKIDYIEFSLIVFWLSFPQINLARSAVAFFFAQKRSNKNFGALRIRDGLTQCERDNVWVTARMGQNTWSQHGTVVYPLSMTWMDRGGNRIWKGWGYSSSRSVCKFRTLVSIRVFWAKRHYFQPWRSRWGLHAK